MNLDSKDELIKIFADEPTPHGQIFDDNRRWCIGCQSITSVFAVLKTDHLAGKICPNCSAIWPEHADEIIMQIYNEEDFLEDLGNITLN